LTIAEGHPPKVIIEIPEIPVSWSAHQGFGRKAYNPKQHERTIYQVHIRNQYQLEPISLPVSMQLQFFLPIPSQTSKAKRKQMLDGKIHHIKHRDTTNFIKFCEDTLKGIVFYDDCQVVEIHARKLYGETPKTLIVVTPLTWS
jgi:Holliday junction resolvase RusA-like endonuclease